MRAVRQTMRWPEPHGAVAAHVRPFLLGMLSSFLPVGRSKRAQEALYGLVAWYNFDGFLSLQQLCWIVIYGYEWNPLDLVFDPDGNPDFPAKAKVYDLSISTTVEVR